MTSYEVTYRIEDPDNSDYHRNAWCKKTKKFDKSKEANEFFDELTKSGWHDGLLVEDVELKSVRVTTKREWRRWG